MISFVMYTFYTVLYFLFYYQIVISFSLSALIIKIKQIAYKQNPKAPD